MALWRPNGIQRSSHVYRFHIIKYIYKNYYPNQLSELQNIGDEVYVHSVGEVVTNIKIFEATSQLVILHAAPWRFHRPARLLNMKVSKTEVI